MDQALQGKIDRFTLPEIFQLLSHSGKTGTLGIQKDDDIVMVYFNRGRITYAYGPNQARHIGEILKNRGKLTAEQLEEAVKSQTQTEASKKLGRILVDKKFIERSDLETVVKEQVEELIYSLLSWESGSFKFYENQYPTDEEITVNLSVENVILEGLRRIDEINRFKGALPDFGMALTISPTSSEQCRDISLRPEEWNLLSLIDGRKTINEIMSLADQPQVKTLERLAAMKMAGLISSTDKKSPQSDHLTAMVNRVSSLLEDYLDYRSGKGNETTTTTSDVIGE